MQRAILDVTGTVEERRQRLRSAIDNLFATQSDFAEAVGMTQSSVSRALSAKSATDQRLAQIEHALMRLEQVGELPEVKKRRNSVTGTEIAYIPLVSVTASAGNGDEVYEEVVSDYVAYPIDAFRRDIGVQPDQVVIVRVSGTSMQPTLQPGDRVFVAKHRGEPILDGVIYVFRHRHAGVVVKRAFWMVDGSLELRSDNRQAANDWTIASDDEHSWDVVGRVVNVQKPL